MSKLNEQPVIAILCVAAILLVSWGFNYFTMSTPERMQIFNYVMLIPAPIALAFYLYESKSFAKVLSPILKVPSFGSISFSVLFPILFLVLLAGIIVIIGQGIFRAESLSKIIETLPKGSGLLFAFLVLFGEEYAWRGYLLPRFTDAWGPVAATAFVGVIWAIWHGPIVYGLASKLGTTDHPMLLTLLQMSAVFVLAFPFAFAFYQSGSIVPPMIIHFLWNWLNPAILGNVYRNQPGIVEGNILLINGETLAGVILGLFFVAWFILRASPSLIRM